MKQRYQIYPKALARAFNLLGKQGPALRGHRENSNTSYNQGNSLTLNQEIAHYYPLLKNYLEDSVRKGVKYLRPKNQN